jgi:hypothetical protein
MSENHVIVQFYGICTHITMPDTNHRVILVHASEDQINRHMAERVQKPDPHVGRLQIRENDIVEHPAKWFARKAEDEDPHTAVWRLEGISLRILNADDSQPESDPDGADAIPRLTTYCEQPDRTPDQPPVPPLRAESHAENSTADAAVTTCFFDFPNVTPVARRAGSVKDGPTVSVFTINTSGEPVIEVQRFRSQDKTTIKVRSGAQITVSSYPENPGADDKNLDFLLHFLATTEVPKDAWHPPQPPWRVCETPIETNNPALGGPKGTVMTGPGCSNSTYP